MYIPLSRIVRTVHVMKWDQTVNKFQLNVLYIHVHENLGEYVHRFIFVFSLLLNMTMKGISAKGIESLPQTLNL